MIISQDLLIDTALNVLGYVAAGALWLALSSLFHRSPKTSVVEARKESRQENTREAAVQPEVVSEKRRLEYVNLKGFDSTSEHISRAADAASRSDGGNFRRNRAEVMRMAREMLEAGSTRDRVRQTLPISEGELALLTRE
jgi:hypothetical protein